jgi:hypothetical protein
MPTQPFSSNKPHRQPDHEEKSEVKAGYIYMPHYEEIAEVVFCARNITGFATNRELLGNTRQYQTARVQIVFFAGKTLRFTKLNCLPTTVHGVTCRLDGGQSRDRVNRGDGSVRLPGIRVRAIWSDRRHRKLLSSQSFGGGKPLLDKSARKRRAHSSSRFNVPMPKRDTGFNMATQISDLLGSTAT